MDKSQRNAPLTQDPVVRGKNFKEVSFGFNDELVEKEARRCIQCKHAPCMRGCPVGVKIPMFIQALLEKDKDKAVDIIKSTNSLPAVCGRVCPQEKQCENLCVRKRRLGGSVAIGELERYVGDYALSKEKQNFKTKEKLNKKVAVIGSGPAGLSCAGELIANGVDVCVYEAFHKTGGVLTYGIPEFRLPKQEIVQKEINLLKEQGVEFKLNMIIGKTVTIDQLKQEYDYIFIGTGAGLPVFLGIEGETLNGVYSANEYLTRVNLMSAYKQDAVTPIQNSKNVAVIGAGNVAMDAARTALRLGAENVYIVYRRSREEMPARIDEIHHAEEEGIQFALLRSPIKIVGDKVVEGLKLQVMELAEPDSSGRARPIPVEGEIEVLDVDTVIVSLGTNPNPLIKNSYPTLQTTQKGTFIVNEETMESSDPQIYAGGDAVTGAATVILAMGAGRQAAKSIIAKLKGE